jgi:hypothetical protein
VAELEQVRPVVRDLLAVRPAEVLRFHSATDLTILAKLACTLAKARAVAPEPPRARIERLLSDSS